MIADVVITEKSFGPKVLMTEVKFSINDGEKIGVIGRNGVGKSTLFGILTGSDKDFSGAIVFQRGSVVVSTKQEYHEADDLTVLQYILSGLPEYTRLSQIIETYPTKMGENIRLINEYSAALERFLEKSFYQIEDQIERELDNFQLVNVAHRAFNSLSGGEKRLAEVVKIMHSNAQLALIDEPTNHMDYVAKAQFINWLKNAKEAVLVITHDRDVLSEVDRIIELKDGGSYSFKGNYDAYLRQNTISTSSQMNEYEVIQRQIDNLKKRIAYAKSKKASWGGTADKRNPFVVMENKAKKEMLELQKIEKPSFWIDKVSADGLDYKTANRYQKYKSKNIRLQINAEGVNGRKLLVSARGLTLGYANQPLFAPINFELHEGESIELRGRNGAGKSTLINTLLGEGSAKIFSGELKLDSQTRIGLYEQEVSKKYFNLSLKSAVEVLYANRSLNITEAKIRQLLSDYLFTDSDINLLVRNLSGGQKARFQIISMLANDPQLLILDEPTNHLDLPSIEELEDAMMKYHGAILFVSHDDYFRSKIASDVVMVEKS